MALEVVKKSVGRSLTPEEILAITDKCGCGQIKQAYQQLTDGSIRKVGLCPECMRENLARARAARVPGAPRKRRKTQEPEPAQPTEQSAPSPAPDLRERLEAARREAIERAEQSESRDVPGQLPDPLPETPTHAGPSCPPVTLYLSKYDGLYVEIALLAKRDVRSIEGQIIWILKDYCTYERSLAQDVLERAKRERQATQ